jgi:hypothetical protein
MLQKMHDSMIEISIDEEEDGRLYFKRFFCALDPCPEGFHEVCSPYLSVDSTTLNGRWNDHLPSATGVDGHNWMFPIVFGYFEGESKDSWTWFLLQLFKAIGQPSALAIHCDASKGLIRAVRDIFPQAEMRECFRHLMQNYIKQFSEKEHMYPAARTYMREVHEQHKANVVQIDGFVMWMKWNHPLLWYRSGFNMDIKCDYITNNIPEVFNNWVKDHKDLPICELADKIRVKIMKLFFQEEEDWR